MPLQSYLFTLLLCISIGACDPGKPSAAVEGSDTLNPDTSQELQEMIHYQVYGSGEFTLLFVHGWGINQTYWDYQVDVLQADYKIVSMDLPGFGKSGKERDQWTVEAYGEDVNRLIDQLQLKQVILIGHSMGGEVILEAALNNKEVLALIGVDNFKDIGLEMTTEMQAEIENFLGLMKENYSNIASGYARANLFHESTDSGVITRVVQDISQSDSTVATQSLEHLFRYSLREKEKLAKLDKKLYLINSDATPTHTDGLDATGVQYEVLTILATGHYPMVEKPVEFTDLLREALLKIVKTPT